MATPPDGETRRRALVTGASSGIGAAFAARLARDGYDLVVVARRGDRLRALARRLEERHGAAVEVVVADLSLPADVRAVEARVAGDAALEVLVNNAGFLSARPFVREDPEAIEAMLRVHVVAPVRLCRAALPGMLARDRGVVVNVSSIGAWDTGPSPQGAVYSATKAFVNTFTLGLESQVRGTGVRVQALCPAATRTEIHARAGVPFDYPASAVMTPEALVDASLAGLRLGEVVCVPALDDPALLGRLAELQDALWDRAIATGTPAARYAG